MQSRLIPPSIVLILLSAVAAPLHGQTGVVAGPFGGIATGLVLEDASIGGHATAWSLGLALGYAFHNRLRLSGDFVGARRDFAVGADQLHRNLGFLSVGVELAVWRPRNAELAFAVRVGATADNDISETDPDFRSSTNWTGAIIPAAVFRYALGRRLAVTLHARDYVQGVSGAIFDPEEGGLVHDFVLDVGVTIR